MHVYLGWPYHNWLSRECRWHRAPNSHLRILINLKLEWSHDVVHLLIVIRTHHSIVLFKRGLVSVGAPVRLMSATPPPVGAISVFSSVYEVARQYGVDTTFIRETS